MFIVHEVFHRPVDAIVNLLPFGLQLDNPAPPLRQTVQK